MVACGDEMATSTLGLAAHASRDTYPFMAVPGLRQPVPGKAVVDVFILGSEHAVIAIFASGDVDERDSISPFLCS